MHICSCIYELFMIIYNMFIIIIINITCCAIFYLYAYIYCMLRVTCTCVTIVEMKIVLGCCNSNLHNMWPVTRATFRVNEYSHVLWERIGRETVSTF